MNIIIFLIIIIVIHKYLNILDNENIKKDLNFEIYNLDDNIKIFLLFLKKEFNNICNISGDIVEVGVLKNSYITIFKYLLNLNKTNKNIYLYDTFDNYTKNNFSLLSYVNSIVDKNVKIIKGDIKDTGFKQYPNKISLLYLNLSCYTSTYDSLNYFYHRVSEGGYIILNNYKIKHLGCKKAIDKFMLENNIEQSFLNINNNSYFFKKKKTFIKYPINNYSTFANFNCNFEYIKNNDMLSSVILNNTFYFYNASKNLINQTIEFKNKLKNINIIWGIKLNNNSRRWEYYVYGWNPIYNSDIYSIVRTKETYFYDYKFIYLLKVFFNNDKSIDYYNCNKLFNRFNKVRSVQAIGFDVSEDNKTDKYINFYTYLTDKDPTKIPITTYGYSMDLENLTINLSSYIYTHKIIDSTFIPFLINFVKKYNCSFDSIFEKDYYINSQYVALCDKFKTNELGIYYHCIDINNFINFLIKYKYKSNFIKLVKYNKKRFENYSFEIAINYKIINGNITNIRTAFYGVY